MSYQVLARKWRPRRFEDVVGQEHVLKALINALTNQRLHHAYLFTGTRGVGKTTLGRIFAKSLNCEVGITAQPCGKCAACTEIDSGRFVDLLEVDAASRTRVEDTRELLVNVQYAPTVGRYKVYLIDEVHMLSNHSFNALLKTLEEPPPHIKFLLATTDPQKLPVTILSRCLQFNLKRLSPEAIAAHLNRVTAAENVSFEVAALALIARAADGSVRDALSLLDQAIAYSGGEVSEANVVAMLGTLERGEVYGILTALAKNDGSAALAAVDQLAQGSADFRQIMETVLSALHDIAVLQTVGERVGDVDAALATLADEIPPEDVQLFYQIGVLSLRDLPYSPDERMAVEMALLRMVAFRPAAAGQENLKTQNSSLSAPIPSASTQRVAHSPPRDQNIQAKEPSTANQPTDTMAPNRGELRPSQPAKPISESETPREAESSRPRAPVTTDWSTMIRLLKLDGMARQLAANCAAEHCGPNGVRLTLAHSHSSLHSQKLELRLRDALRDYFKCEVPFSIKIGEVVSETPALVDAKIKRERQQEAEADVANDSTVRAMLDKFNGQIVPGSVRPTDAPEK